MAGYHVMDSDELRFYAKQFEDASKELSAITNHICQLFSSSHVAEVSTIDKFPEMHIAKWEQLKTYFTDAENLLKSMACEEDKLAIIMSEF